MSIHGYTGSALRSDQDWTGMSEHADNNGYVVVYPQSTSFGATMSGRETTITSWNDLACSAPLGPAGEGPEGPVCSPDADSYPCPPECGDCGPCNWCSCHDDVGAISALLDELERTLCLDLERVFAVGYSNGGMFVHRLGCVLEDRFAAVAPFHGTLARGFNCAPGAAGPGLLVMGGTEDRTVPIDGSRSSDGYYYTDFSVVAEAWSDAHFCSAEAREMVLPSATASNELRCFEHEGCETGRRVVRCSWKGAHDWPKMGGVPFGNDLLWQFFESNVQRLD